MNHTDVVRNVEWALLIVQQPGQECLSAGILLVDPISDQLHVRLLAELPRVHEDAVDFWRELPQDLLERSRAIGGHNVLNWLETTASHFIQLGRRHVLETTNPENTVHLLYWQHVVGDPERSGALKELRHIAHS